MPGEEGMITFSWAKTSSHFIGSSSSYEEARDSRSSTFAGSSSLLADFAIQILCHSSDRGHECTLLLLMKGSHQSLECFGNRPCLGEGMHCAQ